jgi:hypothetical protein
MLQGVEVLSEHPAVDRVEDAAEGQGVEQGTEAVRSHGIDRITAWCLTPFCCHQAKLTFEELAAHGANEGTKLLAVKPRLKCTKCGGQYADLQPDWSQRSVGPVARSSST